MKIRWLLVLALNVHCLIPALFAQGSLTPPGAPAATMKSLAQIEPRTPIAALPFNITNAGSYYLTTNLTGTGTVSGITISVGDVTVDLMGFALIGGGGGGGSGIVLSGSLSNIVVRNGTIRGWFTAGMHAIQANNSRFERLEASANGGRGLYIGNGCTVNNCTARGNDGGGIIANLVCVVTDCAAYVNGGVGISAASGSVINNCVSRGNDEDGISADVGCTISTCVAYDNNTNGFSIAEGSTIVDCTARFNNLNGIEAAKNCTIRNCTVLNNDTNGIIAANGSTISGCTVNTNRGNGIRITSNCRVVDNHCDANGKVTGGDGAGIYATGVGNHIENNNVSNNDRGIQVDSTGSLIIRNSAASNATDYQIAVGNRYGAVINITAGGAAAVNGNSAVSTVNSTDPWANFAY